MTNEAVERFAPRLRSILLCHHDSVFDRELLARWLASWSVLVGIVEVRDNGSSLLSRARHERRRSGWLGLVDVMAFWAYYRLALAARDAGWQQAALAKGLSALPALPANVPIVLTTDPNSTEIRDQLLAWGPDFGIARIKHILRKSIYNAPTYGTFVLHPGICPDYRNAHGCFWAIARSDLDNVGATLLKIDDGVDTGPVYAHLRVPFDPQRESYVILQHRAIFENLPVVRATLEAVCEGRAQPVSTAGRPSNVWGQPRLSAYLKAKARL